MRTSLNPTDGSRSAGEVALVALETVPSGTFVEVQAELDGEVESIVLYRDGEDARAWLNICPHAGRRLDFAPGQFLKSRDGLLVCAAHGAAFEIARGECMSGPCRGQSLRSVPVEIRDGAVWLAPPDKASRGI